MINLLIRATIILILLTVSCYAWSGVINKKTVMYKNSGDHEKNILPILILEKGDSVNVHTSHKTEYRVVHSSGAKGWVQAIDVEEIPSTKKYLTPEKIKKKRNLMEKLNIHRPKQRPPQNPTRDIVIQEIDSNNNMKMIKHNSVDAILAVLNSKFLDVLNDSILQEYPIEMGIDNSAKNHVSFILNEKNEVSNIELDGEIFLTREDIFKEVLKNMSFYHNASGKYLIIFPIRFKE